MCLSLSLRFNLLLLCREVAGNKFNIFTSEIFIRKFTYLHIYIIYIYIITYICIYIYTFSFLSV